jgi:peroxiredoxin
MIKPMIFAACLGLCSLFSILSLGAVEVGSNAPDFELQSHEGKKVKLSDFKGKIVVLEWTNQGCPFVKAHYLPGAMQKLQEEMVSKGVVWLQIHSSAPGKEGFLASPTEAKTVYDEYKMKSTALLLDPTGSTGKAYAAKTTPHFFILDAKGVISYAGAIDSNPRPVYDPQAQNYVKEAVDSLLSGKKMETPGTKPYGCSVKY